MVGVVWSCEEVRWLVAQFLTMDSSVQTDMGLKLLDNNITRSQLIASDSEHTKPGVQKNHEDLYCNNGKLEDLDETSSGYSSRESHCGHCREPVQSHRPQRSSRNCATEDDSTPNEVSNKKLPASIESINDRKSLHDRTNDLRTLTQVPESESRVLSRQSKVDLADKDKDDSIKKTNDSIGTCTTAKNDEYKGVKKIVDNVTQTEVYQTNNDLIKILTEANKELQRKLKRRNSRYESLIENLESQLLTALTEIAQLKIQLSPANKHKIQPPFSCSKCGYLSEEEEAGTKSHSKSKSFSEKPTRRTISIGCLEQSSSSLNLPSANTVKAILKGQSPSDMKLTLLQRNKELRDEIETLKIRNPPRALSTTSMTTAKLSKVVPEDGVNSQLYHSQMDRIIKDESEKISVENLSNQRSMKEDVRWKKSSRVAAKQRCKHSTSQAFRTINVQTWGQTT